MLLSFAWCITCFHMYVFIFSCFILYTHVCVKYLPAHSALENHLWCFPLNYSAQIFFCFFKLSLRISARPSPVSERVGRLFPG